MLAACVSMVQFYFGSCDKPPFAFTFTATATPPRKFSFDQIDSVRRPLSTSFKRRRPLWDVDGGPSEGKKKRRLRLNLITSRLSRPFSQPASNIVDRGISKIAIWAKGRRLDKNLLRKAAIMNRVRTSLDAAKATRKQMEVERGASALRQVLVQKPRFFEPVLPLPPSPLGLSNYDALDLEDEMFDEDEEGCQFGGPRIYSDFNIMKPCSATEGDEYDYLDELDGIPHDLPEERPPLPAEGLVDILKEKERQREVSFVKFVA